MYHVSRRSCSALPRVAFLMFSSTMPWVSHTDLITNQNRPGSSTPTPLNIGSLIALIIPTFGGGGVGGGVGVGVDGFDIGEVGGCVDRGSISGKCSLINQIALLGENLASSSSLSREIEAKGLFSIHLVPW